MADIKWSQFPSATDAYADDKVVGLKNGQNVIFSFAKILALIRQNLSGFFIPTSQKGAANGVASLDNMGKVPSSQLPPIASTAEDVTYDNTQSGLTAEDVQEAIDELAQGGGSAANVTYDPTISGLSATDVQEAIDELAAGAGGGGVDPETIAPVEESSTATTAHPLGTVFYYNDLLYRALANIAVGDTINTAVGGNATQTSIAQNFKRTVTLTSAEYAQLSAAEKAADIVYIVTDDNTIPAEDVSYDPTTSGLTATNVQDAIDEVVDDLDDKQASIIASGILKGDGQGGVSAATPGTDYQAPLTAGTDYATPAQLADKANLGQIGYPETGTTASRNYTAGEYICWNGLLYTADTAIASGATFYTSGGNKNLTECVGGGLNYLSGGMRLKLYEGISVQFSNQTYVTVPVSQIDSNLVYAKALIVYCTSQGTVLLPAINTAKTMVQIACPMGAVTGNLSINLIAIY